jgi:hypothetical protein
LIIVPTLMTVIPPTEHGDFHYDVVAHSRTGAERVHRYATDEPLEVGSVVRLEGRSWLIEQIEPGGDDVLARALANPARYRLTLHHPDGQEEHGATRRFRPDTPRVGHTFSTLEDGRPITWEVTDQQLGRDDRGPYVELIARRDFSEVEEAPDHELEHALARRQDDDVPESVVAMFARAEEEGLELELVALEPGEEPDWPETDRSIEALTLEVIEDDLVELAGVDTTSDPRHTWLATVKRRLSDDRDAFRAEVEGEHDQIEEWDFRGGRIFVSLGTHEDEADPESGHGWMCRLLDAGVLRAAGFERVRKAELELFET